MANPYSPNPQYPEYEPRQRTSFRWWRPILYAFLSVGMFFLTFIVIIALGLVALMSSGEKSEVEMKEHSVLRLRVNGPIAEHAEQAISFFGEDRSSTTFLQVLTALRKAKTDPNIDGLYFSAGDVQVGSAKAHELREAILDFKTSGKFFYAFIEAGSERDYFFASAADSIFMPTEGLLEMNGFGSVYTFYKGFLDKIGVKFEIAQFEEYKSAPEVYMRKNFTAPAREEIKELVMHRHEQFVNAVATSRNIAPSKVQAILHEGKYDPQSLLAEGIITGIRSEQRVRDAMRDRTRGASKSDDEKTLRMVTLQAYINAKHSREKEDEKAAESDKQIAIIAGSGTIVSGSESDDAFGGNGGMMTAQAMIKYLRKARENKKVKAIILRIDSPGGSVMASDAIWEEIQKTRAIKPVYASMSDYAASGGYYVAMPCDTIIAHPETITGSIGVFITIPNAAEMIDKIGVSVDTITSAPHALFLDPAVAFTAYDREKLYKQAEGIYKRFVGRVAEARGMEYEQARAIAKGRVWLGATAKQKGLVDTLGGLQTAIDIAKRRIGLDPKTTANIRFYPENRKLRDVILERIVKMDESSLEASSEYEQTPTLIQLCRSALREMIRGELHHEMRATLNTMMPGMGTMTEQLFLRIQQEHWRTLYGIAKKEHVMVALPYMPIIE